MFSWRNTRCQLTGLFFPLLALSRLHVVLRCVCALTVATHTQHCQVFSRREEEGVDSKLCGGEEISPAPAGSRSTAGGWRRPLRSLWPPAEPGPCLAGTGDPCRSSLRRTLPAPPWNAQLTGGALWPCSARETEWDQWAEGGVKQKEWIYIYIRFYSHDAKTLSLQISLHEKGAKLYL